MADLDELLQSLAKDLLNILIYIAIALVFIIGLVKCVLPVSRAGQKLRKGIRSLEMNLDTIPPVWQDVKFLGKNMQGSWRRFLVNAEQLDARGMNCNVEDYVNDDTVIYSVGHAHLADAVPGLLTSLGILGTFIGLVQGLGGLNLSDTAQTMQEIPKMIEGMTYAFTTSIAGVSCSLIFNMFNRMAHGSAIRAIDDFNDAFTQIVMQKPLEPYVQMILQQEDRTALLRHMSGDMATRVTEGIAAGVERSLMPVAQQMNQFILGQTQAQIDGVNGIVENFIQNMNRALNGQFLQLGKTLTTINQAQSVSYDTISTTMAAADDIMKNLHQVQHVTQQIMDSFNNYIQTLDRSRADNEQFLQHGSEVLSGMVAAASEQTEILANIRTAQKSLQTGMQDYVNWSSQMSSAINDQTEKTIQLSTAVTREMNESGRKLSENYANFVDDISRGFSVSMKLFEENINRILQAMHDKLAAVENIHGNANAKAEFVREAEGCAAALSRLQVAIRDMTDALNVPEEK
ncbi:MAG: MotA/TolQ/ExbB proton channel family protein [Clostridia bacterium]|nr:MotA/TolQ/ExbB proton channel family protein [Clostridia bacterium]